MLSLLVQPITSPTLAVTGSGEKAKFLIVTLTVAAAPAAAGAQAAALLAPPVSEGAAAVGAADAGAAAVAGATAVAGAVVTTGLGVAPVPQAPRTSVMAIAAAERSRRCIEMILPLLRLIGDGAPGGCETIRQRGAGGSRRRVSFGR